jgi:hypothetical protein
MGLSLAHGLGPKLRLTDCFEEVFDRMFQVLSAAEVLYNFCSSSLMTCRRQNR